MIEATPIPFESRHIEMSDYWYSRYLEALSQMDSSSNPKARMTYLELANHYKAMHRLCGHMPRSGVYCSAA
jgi:hypothetical protein